MKRRQSILFYVLICFVLVYTGTNLTNYYRMANEFYDDYVNARKSDVAAYLNIGATTLEKDDLASLNRILKEGGRLRRFDFYSLRDSGMEIDRFPEEAANRPTDSSELRDNMLYETSDLVIGTIVLRDYRLVIGAYKARSHYLRIVFEQNKWTLVADICLVMLAIALIVSYYLRDIRRLAGQLQKTGGRDFDKIATQTAEAELFKRGFVGFESQVEEYKERFRLLDENTLPALKSELFSGTPPPYDFACTLVRTDINSYSTILREISAERFMPVVNTFFIGLTDIVGRYGGQVKEFLGDEAIFYFKDSSGPSVELALGAIRDIQELAKRIDEKNRAVIGQSFTVKSAVAYGTLHFGPLVHSMNTSGAMFIETVRMLGEIKEKDRSHALLSAAAAERAGRCFEVAFEKRAQLRGFKDDAELYILRSFKSIDIVLGRAHEDRDAVVHDISLFRSDDDLVTALHFLRLHHEQLGSELTLLILATLKNEKIGPASDAVVEALCGLLEIWQEQANAGSSDALFRLSSLTMLVAAWKFAELQAERLAPKLAANLGIEDRRVVSNTIDAFTVLMPSRSDSAIERLLKESDNRIRANALVKQGLVKVDRAVVKGLGKLLANDDATYVASGIYALTEIVRNYRAIDPVFLAAHADLQALITRAAALKSSEHEMVLRQLGRLERVLGDEARAA